MANITFYCDGRELASRPVTPADGKLKADQRYKLDGKNYVIEVIGDDVGSGDMTVVLELPMASA